MGVKHKTVKAHELRRGDVIVHAKTGERYTVVEKAFYAGRIRVKSTTPPTVLFTIRCESDQDVLIEAP